MSDFTSSESLRAIAQMVMIADVVAVDAASARARVKFGADATSAWLPWLTERASSIAVWAPPSEGEQVLCLSPSGQTRDAVILGAIFSGPNPAPSASAGEHLIVVGGSSISITGGEIVLSSNGTTLTVNGAGMTIAGPSMQVNTGSLSHNGTDVGDTHTHRDVTVGPDRTGDPK
ncbi:phage baseplate assembly protein V [uncultured Tateyamaria sp.]|uniref:phage baseplate assembly protein V n=1 Tax=uncultured Tateyamaria sp. TaxID=455651 RepID=UPI00260E18BC|nr:phage baseplate assembly protein V [uncultured Tateyamaria sp.]